MKKEWRAWRHVHGARQLGNPRLAKRLDPAAVTRSISFVFFLLFLIWTVLLCLDASVVPNSSDAAMPSHGGRTSTTAPAVSRWTAYKRHALLSQKASVATCMCTGRCDLARGSQHASS